MQLKVAFSLLFLCGCVTTGIPQEETFNYSIIFCDQMLCLNQFMKKIAQSEEALCALYNADKSVISLLERKKEEGSAEIIINSDAGVRSPNLIRRKTGGLMHNKFCVFDRRTVWTGSFNPVKSGKKTYDDVLIIESEKLAKNYLEEFEEMKPTEA